MAPEQAQGKKEIDHRADLYSLGVILFQALTGQYPFDDDSYPMLIVKICTQNAPSLSVYRPDLPPELGAIVARLLEKSPEKRFQRCEELKRALVPFLTLEDKGVVADVPGTKEMVAHAPDGGFASGVRLSADPSSSFLPAQKSSNVPLIVGSLVLMIVGAAAVIGWGMSVNSEADEESVSPASSISTPTEIEPIEVETETTTAMNAEVPEETSSRVRVMIRAVDRQRQRDVDAELYLDGRRVPSPFEGELPRQVWRLEARADGYRSVVQDLDLEFWSGGELKLEMTRGRGTDDRRSSRTSEMSAQESHVRNPTKQVEAVPVSVMNSGETNESSVEPTTMQTSTMQASTMNSNESSMEPSAGQEEPQESMSSMDLLQIDI